MTSFPVEKSAPSENNVEVSTREERVDGVVKITAGDLRPNMSYTLRVFARNLHGRSLDAYGVYVITPGRVPLFLLTFLSNAGFVGP